MALASALRSALLVSSLALAVLAAPLSRAQNVGSTAADGFDPNVNGNVYAIAIQSDGKVLLAGNFNSLQANGAASPENVNNIVRVWPDGRWDSTFKPNVDGQINAVALQSDGKIVIGGKFGTVNGTTRRRVARLLSDGTLDATFDPNIGLNDSALVVPDVMALAIQPSDGKVIVGGGFTVVQPNGATTSTTRNRIARFNADGTLDAAFNPNANNMVLALAIQSDGKILVGGGFTSLAGASRNRIARLNSADGSIDSAFDPNANNAISAMDLMPDGTIIIGGTFTTLQPNGASDPISVLRLTRLNLDGTIYRDANNTAFYGSADSQVSAIKVQDDGNILVGGSFASAGSGSTGSAFLARVTPMGAYDQTFTAAPSSNVYAIAVQANSSIVIGGAFISLRGTGATPIARSHVARVSPNGLLDADFRPDANGRVRMLTVLSDGNILLGGTFTSIGGATRSGLVRLKSDGSLDTGFSVDINGPVFTAVQQADGKIVIGGSFSRIKGITRNNMARLNTDGSLDQPYDPLPDAQVNKLILQSDGRVVVAGAFSTFKPSGIATAVSHPHLARINTDGTLDLTFGALASDTIWTMVQQSDGKICLGGSFSSIQPTGASTPTPRSAVARINADGTLDTTFAPRVNGSVFALAVQSNGKVVVAGSFSLAAGGKDTDATTRHNVARFGTDGALDTSFDPNTDGTIYAVLSQSDDSVILAGDFITLQPSSGTRYPRSYIARVTSAGALDDSFNLYLDILPGNQVVVLAPTSSGFLIGGTFAHIGPAPNVARKSRVAKISSSGTVDTTFNLDQNVASSPAISALTLQYDGRILAAGSFASFAGTGSNNLARFYSDSVPDFTFLPNIDGPVYSLAEAPIKGTPVATQHIGLARLDGNGRLRTSFVLDSRIGTSTTITSATIQPSDGKILLTGTFVVDSVVYPVIRINPDGSLDGGFQLVTTGSVNALRVLSDGKILIGGSFTTISSVTRNNIARLKSDGTLDPDFSVAADNAVSEIAFQADGKFVIGGSFASVAGSGSTTYSTHNGIARFSADGVLDNDFNPGPNGTVTSILAQADGKLIVGGNFSAFKPNGATTAITRSYIARLNAAGTVDESVPDLTANGSITKLAAQSDGKILVAGNFTTLGGQTRNFIARLNGSDLSLDAAFNPNANSTVSTMVIQSDGKILIGGNFTALEPNDSSYDSTKATPRNRAARLNVDGSIDSTFNPNFNGQVIAYAIFSDGSLMATGLFTSIQPNGSLLVGGQFSSINGLKAQNLALFGGDGSISSAFLPNPNGAVYAILQMADGRVVIGGSFTSAAGATRNRIVRFNADYSLDTSFDPNANGDVYAIGLQADGKLVIGGNFDSVGGVGHAKLARLNADGSVDSSFNPGVSGAVHTVLIQADGRVVYTRTTGTGTNALGRVNSDGSTDSSFNPTYDKEVISAALQADGKIVVGGSFATIDGVGRRALARLNADGTIDNTVASAFNEGASVTALTIQRDGKIVVGGTFNTVDGLSRFGLARIAPPSVTADNLRVSKDGVITWTRSGAQPEISGVIFEATSDTTDWRELGRGSRVDATSTWRLVGVSLANDDLYVRASAIAPGSPNSSSGLVEQHGYVSGNGASAPPVITSAPAVSGAAGSNFYYAIGATGTPTSYSATGLPAGLNLNSATGVISGTPTETGTFNVTLTATNAAGSGTATLRITVAVPGSTDTNGRLLNLSVLAQVTSDPIIAGFVISGNTSQNVLIRAVGPGLTPHGVTDALPTPRLTVFNSAGTAIHNSTSWGGGDSLTQEFVRLGASALSATSADAAVILTLAPGAYTLHVDRNGNTNGSALAELYDASANPPPANSPRLVNISARGVVVSGHTVVSGFVVGGTTARQILIRGIGPGLTAQGVAGVLSDPTLQVYHIVNGTSSVIAKNDNWETPTDADSAFPAQSAAAISGAATKTGAFALTSGSRDAAVLITLAPGVYTAEANTASSGTIGAAMVEIYEVP